MVKISDSIRDSDGKVMARFIDGENAIVTIMYFDAPGKNGWHLSPIHNTMAHLEFVQLPALPFFCQSTIDAWDAVCDDVANALEFGRFA